MAVKTKPELLAYIASEQARTGDDDEVDGLMCLALIVELVNFINDNDIVDAVSNLLTKPITLDNGGYDQ